MPVATTAGFDTVFGISARTFGAMVEGIVRPPLFAIGPPIPAGIGTLNFDDLRVDAWFGVTPGNTVEVRISLHNAALVLPVVGTISLGPDWSDFFVPATIASGPAGAGFVDLTLTFNFAQTRFDADDEAPLQAAGLTEAQIAAQLGPAVTAAGFPNPLSLTGGTGIPVVPVAPAAAAGAAPGVSVVAVAVQRRPAPAAAGEESVAILFTFQNRPDTPAAVAAGNAAALGPSTFAVGQDLSLIISNRFLFELLASLALESPAGLAVPAASVTATAAGITLAAPAPVVLGGTAGTLTVFTLGAPAAGTTVLPLAVTFVFTADDIIYTVVIAGATMTVGLSNGAIIIGSAIPPAVVTFVVPWWVTLIRILSGVALGIITGNLAVGVVAAVAGGLSVIAEGLIVSAIAGPTAVAGLAGATGGVGGGLIPPAVGALAGGAMLTPPLVFDDLEAAGRATLADPIKVVRRVSSVELRSGCAIDLDAVKVSRELVGFGHVGPRKGSDLAWDDAFGLAAPLPARMATLTGTFASITYADVSSSLETGAVNLVPISAVPLVSKAELLAGTLPACLVLGVQTNRGRLAKVAVWRDTDGTLVLRYVVWDASEASIRIHPFNPIWSLTGTLEQPDTPASGDQPVMHHVWSKHSTQLTALTHRMAGPVAFTWSLDGVVLAGSGSGLVAGANISWTAAGAAITVRTEMGESLDHGELVCDAIDANGLRASDSAQMTVTGRRDFPASPYEGALAGVSDRVRDAMRRWVDRTPAVGGFAPPEPKPDFVDRGFETQVRAAIKAADPQINLDTIHIR